MSSDSSELDPVTSVAPMAVATNSNNKVENRESISNNIAEIDIFYAIDPVVTVDNTSRLKIASGTEASNKMYIILIINHSERGIQ